MLSGAAIPIIQLTVTSSWTDGTPDMSVSQTQNCIGVRAPDGYEVTVAAGVTPRVLRLYVGGVNARARVVFHLSDDSSPDFTDGQFMSGSAWHASYAATYHAGSDGQLLSISVYDEQDAIGAACGSTDCIVELISATLQ